jgi:hypothetical protein
VEIDYSDTSDRLSVFIRYIFAIPILIVLVLYAIAAMVVVTIAWFAILFTGTMPRGMFDFIANFQRLSLRASAYMLLMTDEYPAFNGDADANYPVRLEMDYPESLSRGLIFVKWLLVIPHIIIVGIYGYAASLAVMVAWFAIMFTGTFPRGLFDFAAGYMRWNARVGFYQYLMTDEYPPFDNK